MVDSNTATDSLEFEQELIGRILAGDADAADRFVDRYQRLIYFILQRDLHLAPELADDLFQMVFQRLWEDGYRRLRLWEGEGRFSSYLAVLVRRLAIDEIRKQGRIPITLPEGDADCVPGVDQLPDDRVSDPLRLLQQEERWLAIQQALEQLPARDRELLEARHRRDASYKEIARQLGMTVNHVGVALSRAERQLGRILLKSHPDLFAGYLEAPDAQA